MADDVITRYRDLIDSGELKADLSQQRVATRLQGLHEALANHNFDIPGLLARMFVAHSGDAPKGLYIYGDVGRGKSFLMDMFFETAPVDQKRRVHFHEFMQETHEAIHVWRTLSKAGKTSGNDPIMAVAAKIAGETKLLCFDEFHVSDITDATILGRLFTALFEHGVIVVATSNRHPDELYENGLNRELFLPFLALLLDRVEVVELGGELDHRLDLLNGFDVYYTPLDANADKRMQLAWERLSGVSHGFPRQLPLKGRLLEVPQAASGVARFSFADLCERPLGAPDYLKIAQTFHTILVDRIPVLDAGNANAAKRFVILVDTLYEAHVKLIVSAQAEPESLNLKGDHAFEFKRTSSRLREMQSADYLALDHTQ